MKEHIKVIIPAYNEEDAIAKVIKEIPTIVNEIIVVSNNSTDNTEINASKAGATVLKEARKGYGYACLKGMEYIASLDPKKQPYIVVFLDGDYSDYPEQLTEIIRPIVSDNIDFVIGSRVKRFRETGSMTPQQVFGNWLATFLMKLIFGAKYSDLGPLEPSNTINCYNLTCKIKLWLDCRDAVKSTKQKLSYVEIPVKYKNRIGVSKVSGTIKGTIFAGVKIVGWIFKYSFK